MLLTGRWWSVKVAATAAALSYLVQSPALIAYHAFFLKVAYQGDAPLTPLKVTTSSSHEAKLAFRLVPPLLIHVLDLSVVEYYVLQALLGIATLAGIAWLFHRAGYPRTWAAGMTIAIAFTYVGAVWFVDTQPYFDALAASALVLALCVLDPIVVFAGASVALWTDERAIPALGVVALFHLYRRHRRGAVAVGVAMVAYAALRLYLGRHYGLSTGKGEIGPRVFFDYWTAYPLAIALALEGLWVVIGIAYWRGLQKRNWLVVGAGVLTAASAAISVMVNDVTRSTVYMLPGIVFAVVWLADLPKAERDRLLFWPLVACVLCPTAATIVTSGALFSQVSCYYPLPLRLLF